MCKVIKKRLLGAVSLFLELIRAVQLCERVSESVNLSVSQIFNQLSSHGDTQSVIHNAAQSLTQSVSQSLNQKIIWLYQLS